MDLNLLHNLFLIVFTIVCCKLIIDLKLILDYFCCEILSEFHLSINGQNALSVKLWKNSVSKRCLYGRNNTLRLGHHLLGIQVHLFTLDLYISLRPHLSFQEKMLFEWARLESFHAAPTTLDVSTIRLARAGFYYTGDGHSCRCTFCGFIYHNWRNGDDPNTIHRRFRRQCPFVISGFNALNIPIHELEQCRSPVFSARNLIERTPVSHNGHVSTFQPSGTEDGDTDTRNASFAQKLLKEMERNQKLMKLSTSYNQNAQENQSSNSDNYLQPNRLTSSMSSNLTESQLPVISEQERRLQSPTLQNNGRNSKHIKHPKYVPYVERRASFKLWPLDWTLQQLSEIADSGFFYSGFQDKVWCFHCGLGLSNWESDDNPWVEHARWSSKCPYLLQKKGKEYVDLVHTIVQLQTEETSANTEDSFKSDE